MGNVIVGKKNNADDCVMGVNLFVNKSFDRKGVVIGGNPAKLLKYKEELGMEKIKILYEGVSNNLGGIENYIHNLYKYMDKDKFEVSFLIQKGMKIAYHEEYEKDGVKFFEVEDRKKNYFKYLSDLKNVYKNKKFDFIHIHIMSYSLFERITYACKYSEAKVIVHCHNGGFSKDSKYKKTILLDRIGRLFVYGHRKQLIKAACSQKAGEFAFKKEQFIILDNGVDVKRFLFNKEKRAELRAKMGFKDEDFLMLLVGMFNDFKNHKFLVQVFNEYLKLNKNAKLVLVGEGYLQDDIKKQVKELKQDDNVLFLGKRLDVNDILSMCDVYVMPSISEGISIALIEAQVNGLKCYTSDAVDRNSNITGNVEFISLKEDVEYWARKINLGNNSNKKITYIINI